MLSRGGADHSLRAEVPRAARGSARRFSTASRTARCSRHRRAAHLRLRVGLLRHGRASRSTANTCRAGASATRPGPAATATPATRCSRSSSRAGVARRVKERLPYDFQRRGELTCEGREFLDTVIARCLRIHGAGPAARPDHHLPPRDARRPGARSRLTIDVNLGWSDRGSSHRADDLALIESKSLSGPGPADALLRLHGSASGSDQQVLPGRCPAAPRIAANPWNRLLIRQFGWQRAAEADPAAKDSDAIDQLRKPAGLRDAGVLGRTTTRSARFSTPSKETTRGDVYLTFFAGSRRAKNSSWLRQGSAGSWARLRTRTSRPWNARTRDA